MAPLATVRSWNSCGIEPARTGLAPTVCVPRALNRAGLSESDVDLVEINEAFATMAVACSRKLGFPHDIVNVNGGGIGIGHPVAASGARILVTLIHELRRRGGGIGVGTLCAGGGMGSATVLEVHPPPDAVERGSVVAQLDQVPLGSNRYTVGPGHAPGLLARALHVADVVERVAVGDAGRRIRRRRRRTPGRERRPGGRRPRCPTAPAAAWSGLTRMTENGPSSPSCRSP